tara:strand:+ start:565 stop:1110 length:546 start_codon:yes stop_codon:yes gene_type:complete
MENIFENLENFLNVFDITFITITIYFTIQCFLKGFFLSLLSFLKWIISLIITIILVPKFQPWVSEYIESDFINSIGLGLIIFIISLFTIIVLARSINRAVTWTGLGSVDKSFGVFFGIFKGYIVSVCLFSIFNWFYPYQNWGISVENSISFNYVKKGSDLLIEEFPESEDFLEKKEKIENI